MAAYKESPFLPICLASLKAQTVGSEIVLATSTPNNYLAEMAQRFDVRYVVGDHKSGIGRDWNFAFSQSSADFVTVAHQDDAYAPVYTERLMGRVAVADNPILAYTDYAELRGDQIVANNRLLRIKRLMNAALIPAFAARSRFARDRVFSLGCPISTPSVAYNRLRFPDLRFDDRLGTNLDWDMWQRMSAEPGSFVYEPEVLVLHRVHAESETSAGIAGGYRQAEDYEMYRRYWPAPVAKVLAGLYAKSYASND